MDDKLVEKFWAQYILDLDTDCWNWTGWIGTNGRAQFSYKHKISTAARIAYELHYKKHPGEKYVLHMCDNTLCVNPEHLFLGTQKDNVHDMYAKGREVHPPRPRKLTIEDVKEIRKCFARGLTNVTIAKEFGCTHKNISKIRCGNSWINVICDHENKKGVFTP